ncbi:uncharacterized protein [Antedon mediterranea]|uniref:uncharacterized protein n=1 Tax=Antedon mediterranea TaxID=105859 RepID=UPI003AF46CD5
MERHKCCLQDLCRLCGKKNCSKINLLKSKLCYARDINLSLGVDVLQDVDGIHPNFICNCCKMKLHRWRTFRNKKKDKEISIHLLPFAEHSDDNCSVCAFSVPLINLNKILAIGKNLGFVAQLGTDKVTFIKIINDLPIVCVHIYATCSWKVNVLLKDSTNRCAKFPEILTEDNAECLLTWIWKSAICCGNTEFIQLCRKQSPSNLAVFNSISGSTVAMEEDTNGERTIRHVNCCIFVEGNRCEVCTMYRTTLMSKRSRINDQKAVDISSHARNDQLNNDQLRKKLMLVSNDRKNLQKMVKDLKEKVRKSFEDDSSPLQETMSEALKTIMTTHTETVSEQFKEGSPQRLLWDEQVAANKSSATGRRWHPAIIRFCLALHMKSTAAYRIIRNSGYLTLPHENTLRNYTHFTDAKSGFNPDVILRIKHDIHFDALPNFRKIVSLSFDEMKINAGLVYSSKSGNLVGFSSMGSMNEAMDNFARELDLDKNKQPKEASHMLSLMVRGMFMPLHETFAHFPTHGCKSYNLYWIIWKAVTWLEYAGFRVCAFVCDGASPNRKFYRQHGTSVSSEVVFSTISPYTKRNIYFICDTPHLLKTTRNNLENSGFNSKSRNLHFNHQDLKWNQLLTLVEEDIGCGSGLRKLHKIRHEHLYLTPSLRMKVKLAVQILSSSVAHALEIQGRHDTKSLIHFIKYMNKFFDCLNVSRVERRRNNINENLLEYRSVDDSRLKWLVDDFLGFLNTWENQCLETPNTTAAEKKRMCLSRETLDGLRITVNSFVKLTKELLATDGVDYVLSEKLNQDPLEEYFSKQRGCGGRNENPTVHQFQHNALTLQVAGARSVTGSIHSNTRKSGFSIDSTPFPKRTKTINNKVEI